MRRPHLIGEDPSRKRPRKGRRGGRALGVLAGAVLWLALAEAVGKAGQADPVVRWNRLALDAVRFGNTSPPEAARNLAIVHLAMFDAANSLGGAFVPYRGQVGAPAGALAEAALAAAANRTLRSLWPQFAATFDAESLAHLSALPAGASRTDGVAWGRQVADAILRERDFDGSQAGIDYRPGIDRGRWRPTPPLFASALLPQWPGVTPFALAAANQFRPPGPPGLGTEDWARDFEQTKTFGAATHSARTPEQTAIAWFWADGAGTQTPPGHWNEVAAQLAMAHDLALVEAARLFALLNLALADAGIACWDAKYAYEWWRPVTAIREAEADDNPATVADPGWTPLIATPPFPEYVSGHSTFSAAAATVLAAVHGSDRFDFVLESESLFGASRRFQAFSEAATEAGLSRIYGGIHFSSANQWGQSLGHSVGQQVVSNYLLPRSEIWLNLSRKGRNLELRWPAGVEIEFTWTLKSPDWQLILGAGASTFRAEAVPTMFFRVRP